MSRLQVQERSRVAGRRACHASRLCFVFFIYFFIFIFIHLFVAPGVRFSSWTLISRRATGWMRTLKVYQFVFIFEKKKISNASNDRFLSTRWSLVEHPAGREHFFRSHRELHQSTACSILFLFFCNFLNTVVFSALSLKKIAKRPVY